METPLDRVDSFLTPTELFYVRSHSPTPKLELASYRLQIDGAVRRPSLTYEELRAIPAQTEVALLECAENSRVFLVPHVQGAQWQLVEEGLNDDQTGVGFHRTAAAFQDSYRISVIPIVENEPQQIKISLRH